ncbi:MAG: PaaX family transcriptional regulator C-terminal domain-containing protein [Ornithinimicrobium sp.]|uniref:PaaX family transcriptional regulator n=1 Tax=Ornithinimicrobium sp. TaxID=1977084 RepID=UPI0026DF65E3|nr:PaaX family transcriptional regulator C-terminal domain-containing protein [Ornithinimicrobium sp.]MDO5739098.1 PaaX family transcriptional regulator C-terminal domain-containing protein [Ornithinimicrobium sp.]
MHARSAVVDVYGDHLREHGWWGPVAGVVALAQSCGVQPAATRTAVSRLVREGWLVAEARDGARGYAATPLAQNRLARAYRRIYASGPAPWPGSWHVVVVDHGANRRRRDHVAASLGYLGYGRLAASTWISPRPSPELALVLAEHGATWSGVVGPLDGHSRGRIDDAANHTVGTLESTGKLTGDSTRAARLAAKVWDLDALGTAYQSFADGLPHPADVRDLPPKAAYPVRAHLVHEWRKFLFADPGLPAEVLPRSWPGQHARERFLDIAAGLRPAAEQFLTQTLWAVDRDAVD